MGTAGAQHSNQLSDGGRHGIRLFNDRYLAARQAYGRKELANIGLVAVEHNIADDLTKLEGKGEVV